MFSTKNESFCNEGLVKMNYIKWFDLLKQLRHVIKQLKDDNVILKAEHSQLSDEKKDLIRKDGGRFVHKTALNANPM